MTKSNVFRTSSHEVKEAFENVDSHKFLAWLTPFIPAPKTINNVKRAQENGLETEYAFRKEDDRLSQDLIEELNIHSPVPDLNEVSFEMYQSRY